MQGIVDKIPRTGGQRCKKIANSPRLRSAWRRRGPYAPGCGVVAGTWDRWKDASGNAIETCSILTTTPNAVTSAVHDRMPVILHPDGYDAWLDPGMRDVSAASDLLKPFDARLMRCFPVSTRINYVANDDEECSRPVDLAQIQDRLFS